MNLEHNKMMHELKAKTFKHPHLYIGGVILLGVLVCGYFGYQKYHAITKQNKVLAAQVAELSQNFIKLQQVQQDAQKTLQQLQQTSNANYYFNTLLTAHQLTLAANLALRTENDITNATWLLRNALQRVARVPELASLKQALESDIARLQGSSIPDKEKIIIELNQIGQQVGSLTQIFAVIENKNAEKPVEGGIEAAAQAPTAASATAENQPKHSIFSISRWSHALKKVAGSLRHVVIIQHKESLPIALSGAQLVSLKINLQALLSGAITAVNNNQPKAYQASLKEIATLLQTYFYGNNEVVNVILPSIQKLQQIDLSSKALNVDETVSKIEAAIDQRSIVT